VADEGRAAPEGAVAHALRASEDRFRALVEQSIVRPTLGIMGDPHVNVLLVNRQLDAIGAHSGP